MISGIFIDAHVFFTFLILNHYFRFSLETFEGRRPNPGRLGVSWGVFWILLKNWTWQSETKLPKHHTCAQNVASRNSSSDSGDSDKMERQLRCRPPLRHAPGVRMTVVQQTPINYNFCFPHLCCSVMVSHRVTDLWTSLLPTMTQMEFTRISSKYPGRGGYG